SHEAAAIGDGPVDAAYRAIHSLCQVEGELEEFAVQAVTAGIDAIGEVSVRLRRDDVRAAGHGADTDIIVAAARAYVHAINRMADGVTRGARPTPETAGSAAADGR
ncbi:MAG TPA: alpha-isopropylmalate synthase regulatory domain-containing protein, partial [Candidatus Dormibacteraeota bacterium]|nr:alpha-isopropylmalate synthase regulatory domain-containing protein [Candidatus Dormibacteraeota bacterium]